MGKHHFCSLLICLFLWIDALDAQTVRIDLNYYANYSSECGECNGGPENYIRSRVRLGGLYSGNFESNAVGCGWSGSGCSGGSVGGSNAADWTGQSYYSTVYMQTWGFEDDSGIICGSDDGSCSAGDASARFIPEYLPGLWNCWEGFRDCTSDSSTITWGGRYGFRWTWEDLDPGLIAGDTSLTIGSSPPTLINLDSGTQSLSGSHGTSWQWQTSSNLSTWVDIPGATELEYTPSVLDCINYFRRGIVGNINFVENTRRYTSPVAVYVLDTLSAPEIGNCPRDTTILIGGTYSWEEPVLLPYCGAPATISQVSGLPNGSVFPAGSNEVVYVAINTSGLTDTCSFFVNVLGDCPIAEGLAAVPGLTSVSLSWNSNPYHFGYRISGRKLGDINFSNRTSLLNNAVVGALMPGTTYEWKVRALCINGIPSATTAIQTFTTASPREEIMEPLVCIAPNPSKNTVEVTIPAGLPITGIEVVDIVGRSVFQTNSVSTSKILLDVSQWNSGIYQIVLTGKDYRIARSLVKE